jgi:hypothetical protein
LAEAKGFEPSIFAVTGRYARPLHHASMKQELKGTMVELSGIEPLTS